MCHSVSKVLLAGTLLGPALGFGSVPPPSQTPAVVVVSGHTSTAVSIKVVKVGQEIPATYAGSKIQNAPGFVFYVSEHYALQSNMGDKYATNLLEVAELAYPHWVDLVGAEPPNPNIRMYMVYASTADLMKSVISRDTGLGPPATYGGGITIYANHSAYNYPSGSLQYHQRALAIHENLHMLQMIVFGTGGLEDFTYSGEQSVYDPAKKQLTVMVFDKATINNWTDAGLARYQKDKTSFSDLLSQAWSSGGGPGVILTQFFWTDPDRFLRWQIWRDEYYSGHVTARTVADVTSSIFGPLSEVEVAWQAWLRARHNSFHYVDWGWEQNGDTLWSYGFPQRTAYSETILRYKPSEKVAFDPYRMDYPTAPTSDLVGPVKRGVDDPTVACTIDFSRNRDHGIAGMGLGVVDSSCYAAMIQGENTLVVFSQGISDPDFVLPRKEFPLAPDLVAAAKANGDLLGLTIRIADDDLELTVKAGAAGQIKEAKFGVPIHGSQRDRLMNEYMAVLAKSNSHGITPYIDDGREPSPDLLKNAAPNFWRFDGMDRLETLYKSAWRLGPKAPDSLQKLKSEMLAAVEGDTSAQRKAVGDYEARILDVYRDVAAADADPQTRGLALADLTGTFIFSKTSRGANGRTVLAVTLIDRCKQPVNCTVVFPASAGTGPTAVSLEQFRPHVVTASLPDSDRAVTVTYRFDWRGQKFDVPIDQSVR